LEYANECQHIKLEQDMRLEVDNKISAVKELNGAIFEQLTYIRERLDMHIDGESRKKIKYKKNG
jgi:hypothetical protein